MLWLTPSMLSSHLIVVAMLRAPWQQMLTSSRSADSLAQLTQATMSLPHRPALAVMSPR